MKTAIYILGMLSLAHTDFSSPSPLYSLWLPLVDIAFAVFIVLDLASYLTVLNFGEGHYSLYALLGDILTLNDDIRDYGLVPAVAELMLSLLELVLLITAIVVCLDTLLELAGA